jgi:hypothetical protein
MPGHVLIQESCFSSKENCEALKRAEQKKSEIQKDSECYERGSEKAPSAQREASE